jgi:glutamate-1-semialdehyde 2,1-aminomutase
MRAELGTSYGTSTEVEYKIAKKVTKLVPHVEKVRFVSSGTEATMTAARIARGYTGRDLIIKFNGNYHGHSDGFLVEAGSGMFGKNPTSSSAGVPAGVVANTVSLPFNDPEAFWDFMCDDNNRSRLAGVILEPVAGNMGVVAADKKWLELLRTETQKCGALLIYDEVMCGFRIAKGGASAYFGITPDLSCFGKVVGGGLPAACVGGRADVMDVLAPKGNVYQAGTLSGNPLAMEAGLQTLERLDQPGFYEELERKGRLLIDPIQSKITELELPACIQQVGAMFTIFFGKNHVKNMEDGKLLDKEAFVGCFNHLLEKGVYFPQSQYEACFLCQSHTDAHLKYTADALIEFLEKWASAIKNNKKEAVIV